jgi:hypothetical protein
MVDLGTMTQAKWNKLTSEERRKAQDDGGLTSQLIGFEGCRVEVETTYGEVRRFLVGRSTGWRPCHIELKTIASSGGMAAEHEYKSVKLVRRQRGA